MNKTIWKLYKELRNLRNYKKDSKKTVEYLSLEIERKNHLITFLQEQLRLKRETEMSYSTMSFIVPNLYRVESLIAPRYLDTKPRAEYLTKILTDQMKLKLFDDLIQQGYIQKTRDDATGEVYEIKVVR